MLDKQHKTVGSVEIYRFSGSFDAMSASGCRESIVRAINDGKKYLILDFSGIDFIDSTGLGFLVSILKAAANQGGKLRICGLSLMLKDVFVMTKLDRVFDLDEDEEASLEALAQW